MIAGKQVELNIRKSTEVQESKTQTLHGLELYIGVYSAQKTLPGT